MRDLRSFGDHARRMAAPGSHKPECPPRDQRQRHVNLWDSNGRYAGDRYDPPKCPGCVSDADRALWTRLADEVDAYLTHDDEGLFA